MQPNHFIGKPIGALPNANIWYDTHKTTSYITAMTWYHTTVTTYERHGMWNQRQLECLVNNMFRLTKGKHQNSVLLKGKLPVSSRFACQRASNAHSVSVSCRLHRHYINEGIHGWYFKNAVSYYARQYYTSQMYPLLQNPSLLNSMISPPFIADIDWS